MQAIGMRMWAQLLQPDGNHIPQMRMQLLDAVHFKPDHCQPVHQLFCGKRYIDIISKPIQTDDHSISLFSLSGSSPFSGAGAGAEPAPAGVLRK
jgi:hypothetical protein